MTALLAQIQPETGMSAMAIAGVVLVVFGGIIIALFAIVLLFFFVLNVVDGVVRLISLGADTFGGAAPERFRNAIVAIPRFAAMMLKNLRRNMLRSSLMYLATFTLVALMTAVWSVLSFLDSAMTERSRNVKAIVTEKFQVPSQMPPRYANDLSREASSLPAGMAANPDTDMMSWAFIGAAVDLSKRSRETDLFFFALDPRTLGTMMDDLELTALPPADRDMMQKNIEAMKQNKMGVIIGAGRLARLNKQVGDRIKLYSFNYRDLSFEMDIVGTFPRGRYDESSAMNVQYFYDTLDAYEREKGKRHPMADRAMNLFWVRFPEKMAFETYAENVSQPGKFSSPSVKVEIGSSAISTFLEAYKDIIWGCKYLFSPACLFTMTIVIANGISIGVRERRPEMAVLKVLGFRPWQVLILILGEAVIVGFLGGILATSIAFFWINAHGGIQFPIAFFGRFNIPQSSLWWGPLIGSMTAFLGSVVPAWSARTVKVSEVFAKVA